MPASRALPWIATAACLALSLAFVSWSEVVAELRRSPWHGPVAIGVALPFVRLFLISACDHRIIQRAATRAIPYEDVVRARAATAALPFGVAAGGGYFLWIKGAVRPRGALAAFACIGGGEIAATCLASLAGLASLAVAARIEAPAQVSALSAQVGVGCALLVAIVALGFFLGRRVRSHGGGFAETLRAIPSSVFLSFIVGRAASVGILVIATWLSADAFGLTLPLEAVAVYVPIIVLAGLLPLSVAGFGATQVGWLLFVDYAPAETLLAFHLIWNAALLLGRLLCGWPFMSRVQGEVVSALVPRRAVALYDP